MNASITKDQPWDSKASLIGHNPDQTPVYIYQSYIDQGRELLKFDAMPIGGQVERLSTTIGTDHRYISIGMLGRDNNGNIVRMILNEYAYCLGLSILVNTPAPTIEKLYEPMLTFNALEDKPPYTAFHQSPITNHQKAEQREERWRKLGYEEPSLEERKATLNRNIAALNLNQPK